MTYPVIRPTPELLWLSTVDAGRQLEILASTETLGHQLITFVADDADEAIWVEVFSAGMRVQVPLALLEEAIALAREGVHSESWYVRNGYYGDGDGDLTVAGRAFAKRDVPNDEGS